MTQIPATVELAKPICLFCGEDGCGVEFYADSEDGGYGWVCAYEQFQPIDAAYKARSPQAAQQVAMALTQAQRVEFARKVLPEGWVAVESKFPGMTWHMRYEIGEIISDTLKAVNDAYCRMAKGEEFSRQDTEQMRDEIATKHVPEFYRAMLTKECDS